MPNLCVEKRNGRLSLTVQHHSGEKTIERGPVVVKRIPITNEQAALSLNDLAKLFHDVITML